MEGWGGAGLGGLSGPRRAWKLEVGLSGEEGDTEGRAWPLNPSLSPTCPARLPAAPLPAQGSAARALASLQAGVSSGAYATAVARAGAAGFVPAAGPAALGSCVLPQGATACPKPPPPSPPRRRPPLPAPRFQGLQVVLAGKQADALSSDAKKRLRAWAAAQAFAGVKPGEVDLTTPTASSVLLYWPEAKDTKKVGAAARETVAWWYCVQRWCCAQDCMRPQQ